MVLEIEVDGAQQVKAIHPEALLIFVLPADPRRAGAAAPGPRDDPDTVVARLRKAEDEEPVGLAIADHVVVNDNLDETVEQMLKIINAARSR